MDMQHLYQSTLWQLMVLPPWRAQKVEQCVEITQPEGTGALHISEARKQKGVVSESDLRSTAAKDLAQEEELLACSVGGFTGLSASYADWHTDIFWKKWWLRSGAVMLYVTYNCSRGDEEFELEQAETLLAGLEPTTHNA
jgi:hypothetical protein